MRLSEAIMAGSTLIKWRKGRVLEAGEGCAIGMAFSSMGATENPYMGIASASPWPWIDEERNGISLPCGCVVRTNQYFHSIAHIFDYHVMEDKTWTLEQLVDYVRSVEPAEEEPTKESAIEAMELA